MDPCQMEPSVVACTHETRKMTICICSGYFCRSLWHFTHFILSSTKLMTFEKEVGDKTVSVMKINT